MRYFIMENERQGTCYFEFQKGEFEGNFWLDDSLLLDADVFDELGLYKYFVSAIPDFDYYASNRVTSEQWEKLVSIIPKDSKAEELLDELTFWVRDCLEEYGSFSILGI